MMTGDPIVLALITSPSRILSAYDMIILVLNMISLSHVSYPGLLVQYTILHIRIPIP